jgi:hypothetical protein
VRGFLRHFENTWIEAEGMSSDIPSDSCICNILNILTEFNNSKQPELIGELLFNIAAISKQYNINVDAVLKEHLNQLKIEKYE